MIFNETPIPMVQTKLTINWEGSKIQVPTMLNDKRFRPKVRGKNKNSISKSILLRMKQLLTNRRLQLATRFEFLQYYMYSVVLYNVEPWLLKALEKKLQTFKLRLFRRMLYYLKQSKEVFRIMHRERKLISTIKKVKSAYLGRLWPNN